MVTQEKASELREKLKAAKILRRGHFSLHAGGYHSNFKLDLDCVEEGTELFKLICDYIADEFLTPAIDAVIGVPSGGNRFAIGVAKALSGKMVGGQWRPIGVVLAHKAGEGGFLIEGPLNGKSVLIVEDVVTTGASVKALQTAVVGAGGRTLGAVAIVRRNTERLIDPGFPVGLLDWDAEEESLLEWPSGECLLCAIGQAQDE